MRFGHSLVACAAVAILAAGCGPRDADDDRNDERPAGATSGQGGTASPGGEAGSAGRPASGGVAGQQGASGEVRSIGGELGAVNADQQTFTLMVDGKEQSFRFSDATQVSGASGTQGLAGRKGARVTVYYRDSGGMRVADRIILSDNTNTNPR